MSHDKDKETELYHKHMKSSWCIFALILIILLLTPYLIKIVCPTKHPIFIKYYLFISILIWGFTVIGFLWYMSLISTYHLFYQRHKTIQKKLSEDKYHLYLQSSKVPLTIFVAVIPELVDLLCSDLYLPYKTFSFLIIIFIFGLVALSPMYNLKHYMIQEMKPETDILLTHIDNNLKSLNKNVEFYCLCNINKRKIKRKIKYLKIKLNKNKRANNKIKQEIKVLKNEIS